VPISAALHQSPHLKIAAVSSRWKGVGYLIGSGFEPITPALEADVFTLVPSGPFNISIYPIPNNQHFSFDPRLLNINCYNIHENLKLNVGVSQFFVAATFSKIRSIYEQMKIIKNCDKPSIIFIILCLVG